MASPALELEVEDNIPKAEALPELSRKSEFWSWIRFIVYLGAAYFLIMHAIGLTKVSGDSMVPSLNNGNILLINKVSTYIGKPVYGDVVVVHSPKLPYDIVKRIIAVEGDKVAIAGGYIYVNGKELIEIYAYGEPEDMAEKVVGKGELFVLGDNRTPGESLDSRSEQLGLVHTDEVKGYALIKLIPFEKINKPLIIK